MRDARIHFAINCASKGCPPLHKEAFTETMIESQLELVTYNFVNNEEQTFFEQYGDEDNEIITSQILDWYQSDFTVDQSGRFKTVREFLAFYMDENVWGVKKEDLFKIKSNGEPLWPIIYDFYDWRLNESN